MPPRLIKPTRLEPGQTIGLVAPASGIKDPSAIDRAVAFFEKEGYRVLLGRNARRLSGFLAGTDKQRLEDFHRFWRDDKVRAIVCLRGGYGTARLLDRLDYKLFREKPKIFLGFSDITSIHLAILRNSRLVTFHGPMAVSNFIKEDAPAYTWQSALHLLSDPAPFGSIMEGAGIDRPVALAGGNAGPVSGPLTGGNLALVQTSLATSHEIETKGRIVFLEDLGERPYRIDRMLTHLIAAGKLHEAAAIALGVFEDCEEPAKEDGTPADSPSLAEVLKERLAGLGIPVLFGLPISHTPVNATLPYGLRATLHPRGRDLTIDEGAVV